MSDLNYFDPKELAFSLSDTGILSLDWKGTRYDAVQLTRLFPFQNPEEFLSVSGEVEGEPKELGILRKLSTLPPNSRSCSGATSNTNTSFPASKKSGGWRKSWAMSTWT